MNQFEFNELFKLRTKKLALAIIRMCSDFPKSDVLRIINRQLIRSATSTAANYRAVCLGRSVREKYSKICIVVEEIDETQFWLELLEESDLVNIPETIKKETWEILKVMTASRKTLKNQK